MYLLVLFNDKKIADQIMKSRRPVEQKRFGRQVKGFDNKKWNSVCKSIVKRGNMAKVYVHVLWQK